MFSDLLRALCALGVFVLPILMAWGYLVWDKPKKKGDRAAARQSRALR